MANEIKRWQQLSQTLLQKTFVFDIYNKRMRSPDGRREADFLCLEGADWVNVVPVTPYGEVILVEQFRHGIQQISLEVPGGMIGPRTPDQAALAELEEETGYSSTEIISLGFVHPNSAIQTNRCHLFLARNVKPYGGHRLDELEDITVRLVPLTSMSEMITQQQITHSLTLCALFRAYTDLGIPLK